MNRINQIGRRSFVKSAATIAFVAIIFSPFSIIKGKTMNTNQIIGHGVCIDEDKNIYVC